VLACRISMVAQVLIRCSMVLLLAEELVCLAVLSTVLVWHPSRVCRL
jgi:hypothetical protein